MVMLRSGRCGHGEMGAAVRPERVLFVRGALRVAGRRRIFGKS